MRPGPLVKSILACAGVLTVRKCKGILDPGDGRGDYEEAEFPIYFRCGGQAGIIFCPGFSGRVSCQEAGVGYLTLRLPILSGGMAFS